MPEKKRGKLFNIKSLPLWYKNPTAQMPTLFLSHNSFYVFAPQIATASQPVISLCQRTRPKKVSATKRTFIFLFYSATPSGQTMAEPAAARSGKATVIYWGNLPMPQTPLDAHFL